MTTWRKGPPPSIGWWPASNCRVPEAYRWWNGKWWGSVAFLGFSAQEAARAARRKYPHQDDIEWKNRPADWPERSRT